MTAIASVDLGARQRGRTAVVTGGARGIGAAIAARLVAEGGRVVIADRDGDAAAATAERLGERASAHTVDVTQAEQLAGLVAAVVERHGRLDVWVNNAAHARYEFAVDLSQEDWEYTIGISLTGVFLGSQAAARQMLAQGGGGKIVNVSSISAVVGLARTAAYGASKGGVDGLTHVMAVELAHDDIQVNAVAPGPIRTEFFEEVVSPEGIRKREERVALGRLGSPEDVAAAVAFLASSDADWMTGEVVRVDGGYTVLGAMERRA